MEISLPTIELRDYQLPAWNAFEAGARRVVPVWPRRAGKDTISLQMTLWSAHLTPANYWHLFPEKTQARKALWHGLIPKGEHAGKKILDIAFPHELREQTNETEMLIKFKSGAIWQLGGSDRYDALIGSPPYGVVFSEYGTANPAAYSYVRPILAENHGWALFPSTPRGRNHLFELFNNCQADPNSFAELLTCDDTGHMSAEALALEQLEMSDELFQQEYYCSWDYGIEGAFYAKYMNRAVNEGRVCTVPYDESLPVHCGGDIGLTDSTGLWWWQEPPGGAIHWIDHHEKNGEQPKYYADLIKSKPYTYGDIQLFLPHDGAHRRIGQPKTVAEQFAELGISVKVIERETSIQPGIERCRVAIGKSVFDEARTARGRSCLSAYHREYDDKRQQFKNDPLHDWSSDSADGFRYCVQAIELGLTAINRWGADPDYSELNRAAI